MSYQVGFACFADLLGAGVAACTNFEPITTVTTSGNGGNVSATVTTTICTASDISGALHLRASSLTSTGGSTISNFIMPMTYQPCMYQDFVDAGLVIFAAILTLWASHYGYKKIIEFLDHNRGDAQ